MYSKQQLGYINNQQRRSFKILKKQENENKETLYSEDVLSSRDYMLKEYPNSGDSGSLFLASNKKNKTDKYILKHQYYDCACNEYMYSKIGNEMNIKIASVKLVKIEDKERFFKSDFVCGIKYYEDAKAINYNQILDNKDSIINWQDYFKFYGIASLFLESDGVEVIQSGNFIYRIDTTDAFSLSHMFIEYLAYDFVKDGINIRDFAKKNIMDLADCKKDTIFSSWNISKKIFEENYNKEYLKYYLEPFHMFAKFDENKIYEWSKNITYFYPDIVGEYFNLYLKNIKLFAGEFIRRN